MNYTVYLNNRVYKNCTIIEHGNNLEFIHFVCNGVDIIAKVENIIIELDKSP